MTFRGIASSNSKGLVHGRRYRRPLQNRTWWQRLLGIRYERGSHFEMEPADEATALRALENALSGEGEFSICAGFGGTMDFHPRKEGDVWVDCWFFDSDLNEVLISRDNARRLVQLLFTAADEREVLIWLRKEGATLVPPEVAV